jgi:hypothetical protein
MGVARGFLHAVRAAAERQEGRPGDAYVEASAAQHARGLGLLRHL